MNTTQEKKLFEIENYALKISLEFGENYGRDISERLTIKFPELNLQEIENVKKLCKSIETECWSSVDANEKLNSEKLERILTDKVFKKHKWISLENQKKLLNQFSYYFWKDGLME